MSVLPSAVNPIFLEHDFGHIPYYLYRVSRNDANSSAVYVGDSATLSYLQLLRMMVEGVAGPSPFTVDPRRHRIMENTMTVPSSFRPTHLLPDKQTAQVLVHSYFMNVRILYLRCITRYLLTSGRRTVFYKYLIVELFWIHWIPAIQIPSKLTPTGSVC